MIDMFLSNNPSSGDINSSYLPFLQTFLIFRILVRFSCEQNVLDF